MNRIEPHQLLQIRKILAPIDFSEPSKKGLKYAVAVAREFGAGLILLHVVQTHPMIYELPAATQQLNLILKKDGSENLRKLSRAISGVEFKEVVRIGNPAREILAEAEAQHVDLIILSTHGHTGIAHMFLGSVAERVVRLAKCPVLTVRGPQSDSVEKIDSNHDGANKGGERRSLRGQYLRRPNL